MKRCSACWACFELFRTSGLTNLSFFRSLHSFKCQQVSRLLVSNRVLNGCSLWLVMLGYQKGLWFSYWWTSAVYIFLGVFWTLKLWTILISIVALLVFTSAYRYTTLRIVLFDCYWKSFLHKSSTQSKTMLDKCLLFERICSHLIPYWEHGVPVLCNSVAGTYRSYLMQHNNFKNDKK